MIVFADSETHPIGKGAPFPKPIVLTFCGAGEGPAGGISTGDGERFLDAYRMIFGEGVTSVWANAKYDLICAETAYPELRPLIYRALAEGRVIDVQIIQRLGNLREWGRLDGIATRQENEDGEEVVVLGTRFDYSVAGLMKEYFGIDRTASKEDGVRVSFDAVDGIPYADIDPAFRAYAEQDVLDTRMIYAAQQERWGERVCPTDTMQFAADYALGHMTQVGVALDFEEFYALRARTLEAMHHLQFPHMLEAGVLRWPIPARPSKNQWKKAAALLGSPADRDFIARPADEDELAALEQCGLKIAQEQRESIDTKQLQGEVSRACEEQGLEVQLTDSGFVSTESEFLQRVAEGYPVLEEYQRRQGTAKVLSTELPRMCEDRDINRPADVVHPGFWILKETGRTSSSATDLYPSFNCQNVDPRARGCYRARPGKVLCSVDFGAQDLVSLAQRCLDVFGRSVLAENFVAGRDPHGFLGSVLATHMGGNGSFDYDAFMALKKGDAEQYAFWKHFRTFAKPTGLGFPGGLGPATFVKYARGTFGVKTTETEAAQIKEIWLLAYPEMVDYFAYVRDELAIGEGLYQYKSPLGMVRTKTTYCAACNGFGLQTPSAEATKLATWNLDRACYDESAGNELLFGGCTPLMQIHDEIIVELPIDDLMHERAYEVARIMRTSMRIITPDVPVKAEPALMLNWNKAAEAVFDARGRLTVWRPEHA